MAQYDKLINLGLLNQFLTKAKTIFAPKITASGILKGDGQGGVSAATAGTDYATPAQSLALGLTGASVGDFVRVNAVDSSGKPTSWKKAPLNEIKCNKNYLINHYMGGGGSQRTDKQDCLPINQRGQTNYSGTGYGLDAWFSTNQNCNVELLTNALRMYGTNGANNWMQQKAFCVNPDFLIGKQITVSILFSDGELAYATGILPINRPTSGAAGFSSSGVRNIGIYERSTGEVLAQIGNISGGNLDFIDCKLELGSEQTLAHNEGTEESPVWVLNELPDYGEELAKCQTSRADSDDTYANQEIAIINRNPGAHNSIYRGKYLGSSVTAKQYAAINDGTFDDLYIGDYWTIGGVNYRISAFDYWLRTGDKNWNDGNGNYNVSFETTHHIVVVPDTNLYSAQMHNTSTGQYTEGAANNPVTGAYVGSDMYTTNLAQAKTTINNAFGSAHILNHREYLKNAVNGAYESAGAWYDSTVELMTEQMVYGGKIFANALQAGNWAAQYTIDKSQLPLFALEPSRICNRAAWWLRDVASSMNFVFVNYTGIAHANLSSYPAGVRPAFGIKA